MQSNLLTSFVFRWVFIPFLQSELDAWCDRMRVNNSRKRADCNDIYEHPERFGCLAFKVNQTYLLFHLYLSFNFQIGVEQAAIDHVRNNFAPPDDPVFELVPQEFGQYATILYQSMGIPVVNSENVWDIYCELHHRFEHLDDAVNFIEECQVYLDILDAQDNLDDSVPPVRRELYGGPGLRWRWRLLHGWRQ